MHTSRRSLGATLRAASLAIGASLLGATCAQAASPVPYRGTEKADRIDLRDAIRSYSIKGLGGSDLILAGHGDDLVDGGGGHDTINGELGDDILRGGPGGDDFRTGVNIEAYDSLRGRDTVCDFGKGDRIDFYERFAGDQDDTIEGGNFALFDTNKNGVIDARDKYSSLKKITTCGKAQASLVLDFNQALANDNSNGLDGVGSLTVYGRTSLARSEFVQDYRQRVGHPKPY